MTPAPKPTFAQALPLTTAAHNARVSMTQNYKTEWTMWARDDEGVFLFKFYLDNRAPTKYREVLS